MFRFDHAHFENYRCFGELDLSFEPDTTVLFAENGGGKTALLTGLAMGLALSLPNPPKKLILDVERDARQIRLNGALSEPAGTCTMAYRASVGASLVTWGITASPTSGRREARSEEISAAIEEARQPGQRWPLIAYYGTGRLAGQRKPKRPNRPPARWDGYEGCLDPAASEGPFLQWLEMESLGEIVREQRKEPSRGLARGAFETIRRATRGVSAIWYDPALQTPMVRFDTGHRAPWSELSDGYHAFLGLIGDIARRAAILNEQDGADAPLLVEGVVLIDEIDLHLHPRWQRTVLHGLRAAFPKLQLIVTTHSPQVLSSALNRQVRQLVSWNVNSGGVFVEGRDSNAILVDLMGTGERDGAGWTALRDLYNAIDGGRIDDAKAQLAKLREQWGSLDPEIVRAETILDEEL